MGYPAFLPAEATWTGLEPDSAGIFSWIWCQLLKLFATNRYLAERAWRDIQNQFEPPCPLPETVIRIRGEFFHCEHRMGVSGPYDVNPLKEV